MGILFGRQIKPLRESAKKRVIEMFELTGHSVHSGSAETLEWIIEHCESKGIAYLIKAIPKKCYYIEKIMEENQ